MTTVLMERENNGALEIRFYVEDAWKIFQQDDDAAMPEVCMTAVDDDINSVYIASTCSSNNSRNAIYGQIVYNAKKSLDGLAELDPASFSDGNGIARYHAGISDAAGQRPEEKISIDSLSRNDNAGFSALSRIADGHRALLATGNINNFRVDAQPDTRAATDRLFCLERVEPEAGQYTQRLKGVTVDRTSSANPVITDCDVEISADCFDSVSLARACTCTGRNAPPQRTRQGRESGRRIWCGACAMTPARIRFPAPSPWWSFRSAPTASSCRTAEPAITRWIC